MHYQNPQLPHHLAIDAFPKFGAVRLGKLHSAFTDPARILRASLVELVDAGIDAKTAEEFLIFRQRTNGEQLLQNIIKENIKVIFSFEPDYPALLKLIPNYPFTLYYKGELQNITHPLAVVGSRNFSRYGQEITNQLVSELSRSGLTIISGLAQGIDTLAHVAALNAGGQTWAVLGTGLDHKSLYPACNRQLADDIVATGGCLLSEMCPGTQPMPYLFPLRNRIIAGLSLGTLVIEAALKSGSLITAEYAKLFGRNCFAVPGAINNSLCTGTNSLIKQGSLAVTESADILSRLDLKALTSYSNSNSYKPENEEEAILLSFLSNDGLHIDELVHLSGQPVHLLHGQIAILEIKGAVKNIGNMHYIKI